MPHACCARARSAASCCWSAAVLASSWVMVLWSWVMVLWVPVDGPPCVEDVVVVVVVGVDDAAGALDVEEDWLVSSCTSFASAELTVDCAEETDSPRDVVSRVPSDCPAVTCLAHGRRNRGDFPPTWKEAEASLTGSTVPTTVRLCPMSARATVAIRYPEFPLLAAAQAAAPPPSTTISTIAPTMTARRCPERPQPERAELGTATAGSASTDAAAEEAAAAEATGARCATGRGDTDRGRGHRAVRGGRPEGGHAVTDGQVAGCCGLRRGQRRGSRCRDLEVLGLRGDGLGGLRALGAAGLVAREAPRADVDARHGDRRAVDTGDLARRNGDGAQAAGEPTSRTSGEAGRACRRCRSCGS